VTRVSTFLVLKQCVVAECCKSHSQAALPVSPAGGGGELFAAARSMQGPTGAPSGMSKYDGGCRDACVHFSSFEAVGSG
jgi:hypothetical protein